MEEPQTVCNEVETIEGEEYDGNGVQEVVLRKNIRKRRKRKPTESVPDLTLPDALESDKTLLSPNSNLSYTTVQQSVKQQEKLRQTSSVPANLQTTIRPLMISNTQQEKHKRKRRSKRAPVDQTTSDKLPSTSSSPLVPRTSPKLLSPSEKSEKSEKSSPTLSPRQGKKAIGSFIQRVRRFTDGDRIKPNFTLSREDEDIVDHQESTKSLSLSDAASYDPMQRQREHIVHELVSTEKQYLYDLDLLIKHFLEPLRALNIPKESLQQIFGNLEVIRNINSDMLEDLQSRQEVKGNNNILVGDVFLKLYNYFRLYTMYCIEQQNALSMHNQLLRENQDYANHLRIQKENPLCRKLELPDLLIKPMQRLCKYPLLLRELLKTTTEEHEDYNNLTTAMEQVSNIVQYINERKRLGESQQKIVDIQHSIEDCPSLLIASRKFERDGEINMCNSKNKLIKARLYLFNDALLISKTKKQKLLDSSYKGFIFCDFFLLNDVRIVDHADTNEIVHAFEVAAKSEDRKRMLSAKSLDEKREWLKEIKTIVKNYQIRDYSANKETLIKDAEIREKKRQDMLSLSQTEVNPTRDDNQDVWSMGLVLWQMYTKKPLFEGLSFEQAAVAFLQRKLPPELDEQLPKELKEILEDCWLENPDIRPSFAMIYDRIRALDLTPQQ